MDGEDLKRERVALGLTQTELAEILGTTLTTVVRWENGIRKVNEGWARLALEKAASLPRPAPAPGRRGPRGAQ